MTRPALKEKLALGTVQLGLEYGINNHRGKPDMADAFHILDTANREGIRVLDTADSYGDAIQIIGSYLRQKPDVKLEVISKFIDDQRSLTEKVDTILESLRLQKLYAYMYHRFDDYLSGRSRMELLQLRAHNKIAKVGVSIYDLRELEAVVDDVDITLIQIPFNPFDASIEKIELLKEARSRGKEVHVRSIFLQGLFFKDPEALTGNLQGLKGVLNNFLEIVKRRKMTIRQACLNFALHQKMIDFVVIGVDSSEQLTQNIDSILSVFSPELILELQSVSIPDVSLLNPSNWKP